MDLFTDGTTHVVTDDRARRVRLLRSDGQIAEIVRPLPWRCPLTADLGVRRLYLAAEAFDLDTLAPVGVMDGAEPRFAAARAVALGDGRVVAILRNDRGRGRLAIGPADPRGLDATAWAQTWDLDFPEGTQAQGIEAKPPAERRVARDPRLWADASTAVVSDGPAGVVARFDLIAGAASQVLHFGGRDETELFAEPWGDELLVVSRWAARASLVARFDRAGRRTELLASEGVYAHAVSSDHMVASASHEYLALDRAGAIVDRVPRAGFVQCSAASREGAAVFATKDRVDVVRFDHVARRLLVERIAFPPG